MKRRSFLKSGVVWSGMLWVPRTFASQMVPARSRSFKVSAPALTCQQLSQSTSNNDYYDTGTNIAQKISFAGGTVCQIDLLLYWLSGTNAKCKVQLWSNADRTGTQYGSDSSEVTVTSAGYYPTAAWATFTFGTQPNPPGDFWICLVKTGADNLAWRIDYNHANGSGYYPYTDSSGDAAYCAYAFGANRTTTDCAFKLFTLQ